MRGGQAEVSLACLSTQKQQPTTELTHMIMGTRCYLAHHKLSWRLIGSYALPMTTSTFFVKVKRVYLVHINQLEPRRLDLETVWVLDGESRSIYKAQVDRNTDSQDPAEMILRIRYVLLRLQPCWCQHASMTHCINDSMHQ